MFHASGIEKMLMTDNKILNLTFKQSGNYVLQARYKLQELLQLLEERNG